MEEIVNKNAQSPKVTTSNHDSNILIETIRVGGSCSYRVET